MDSYSVLGSIGQVVMREQEKIRLQIADFLGVPLEEVNELIKRALSIIASTTLLGWEIGGMLGSSETALYGAAIGAGIGIIVVIGSVVYKVFFSKDQKALVLA